MFQKIHLTCFLSLLCFSLSGQPQYAKENYTKKEYHVSMRDGIKLFTAVYSPKDTTRDYPFLILRTPYGIKPYGEDTFPAILGPSSYIMEEKFIFVYQDVRGKYMSEGRFDNMNPYIPEKKTEKDVDNSTDTYDLVEWLLKNVHFNNGKAGLWGISYPGFYAATGIVDAHPAIKCSNPQAPIADWYIGDDMHHNGAFALSMAYNFLEVFGLHPGTIYNTDIARKPYPVKDAYNFFLEIGRLDQVNKTWFGNKVSAWDSAMAHPDYDRFWQERNTLPHYKNIKPAVMTTGGWFDGEDLYGSLKTYQAIEKNNPGIFNILVMGPWIHGGWARTKGDSLGMISFDSPTSDYYLKEIELPFFTFHLKGNDHPGLSEIYAFETGSNTWREYHSWPPENSSWKTLYLHEKNSLKFEKQVKSKAEYDEYVNNPEKPVPYTQVFYNSTLFYNKEYMVEDQRFASARPDVVSYSTEALENDLTVTGPVKVDMYITTTGTDADWVVKIIDVFPDTITSVRPRKAITEMAGFQMLVRGEILRGKYRKNPEKPEPFTPGKTELISVNLQDINHTFKKGHRIMLQVQSTWFPLFDRNPNKFMNIYEAEGKDFLKSTNRILRSKEYPSGISFRVLKNN